MNSKQNKRRSYLRAQKPERIEKIAMHYGIPTFLPSQFIINRIVMLEFPLEK